MCLILHYSSSTEHLSSSHSKHLSSHTYMQGVLMRVLDKLIFSSCTLQEVIGGVLHLHTFSCYRRPFSTGSMVHPEAVNGWLGRRVAVGLHPDLFADVGKRARVGDEVCFLFFSVTGHSALSTKYICQLTFRKVTNVDPSIGLFQLKY